MFDGECASCGGEVEEGDEAGYVDDEVVCGQCRDAAETERRHAGDG